MAIWLRGIPDDFERLAIESVTMEGNPSAVVAAVYRLHFTDGRTTRHVRRVDPPLMYETVVDEVRELNAALARTRWGRR